MGDMNKLIVFLIIFLFAFAPLAAASEGKIESNPSSDVRVTLDLTDPAEINSASVGFSGTPVDDFDTAVTPKATVELVPDSGTGVASLDNGLHVYARIQYPEKCTVTLSVPGTMRGFSEESDAESYTSWETPATVNLGWTVCAADNTSTTEEIKNAPIDVKGDDSGNKDTVVFTHDGAAQATKVYSLPLKIATDDYRGLAANYFAQNIVVTVTAGQQAVQP